MPAILLSPVCHAQTGSHDIDSTLAFIEKYPNDDTTKVNSYLFVSTVYQTLNLQKAAEYAGMAIEVAEKINNKYSLALTLSRLASVNTWKGKTTEALRGYIQEVEIGKALNSDYLLADAYEGIAYVYETEKEWAQALQYSFKSLDIAKKSGLQSDLAYAYHELGSVYLGLNDHLRAEQFIKKAKGIFTAGADTDRIALCNVDLAKVYIQMGYYNLAKPHLDTAVWLFKAWDEQFQVAETYQQLGQLAIKQSLYDDAENYFNQALGVYDVYPAAPADQVYALVGLGAVALGKKDYPKALAIFNTQMEKLKKLDDLEKQLECLQYMAVADSATGNFKEAFSYMQQSRSLYDTVYNQKKNRAAERMLIEFGIERQNSENKILKSKYEEQQSRLIIILAASAVLLLGAIFLVFLYRQKNSALKSIEKLQEETAQRNREMLNTNNVKDKLISMIAHDVRSPLASVQNTLTLTREKILNTDEFAQLSQMLEMDIQHLMGMLDNTLLWAREQMIDIGVNKTTFKIHKVILDVIELYQQTGISKEVTIHNNISKDTEVFSDIDIISTVLRNILSNAVKFTPHCKHIYIEQTNLKSKILISVKDEGVGITDDVLKKINNKEFISTRGTDNEKGTGLGLLFSRDLLIKLGEDFQISSVLGKGTAITISISTH